MLEKDAVETAREMLAENGDPAEVTALLVRLEPRVRGKRTKYDPAWWDRMTAPTSQPSSAVWPI